MSRDIAQILLWMTLFLLSSPVFPISLPVLAVPASATAVFLILTSQYRFRKLTAIVVFGAMIIWRLFSVYVNGLNIGTRYTLLGIVIISVIALAGHGPMLLKKNLLIAGNLSLLGGWLAFFSGIRVDSPASGYGWNPIHYRFTGLFHDPNKVGQLCTILICLAFLQREMWKFAIVPMTSLICAEYRGGIIAIVLVVCLQVSAHYRHAGRRIAGMLPFIFVLAFIKFGIRPRAGTDDVTTGREGIWAYCLDRIHQGAFFGFGPDAVERFIGLNNTVSFQFFHCHNQLLEETVNYGYLGAFLLCLAFAIYLVQAVKFQDKSWMMAGIAYLVMGLFESPLRLLGSAPNAWGVVVFFSLFVVMGSQRRTEGQPGVQNLSEYLATTS